MIRDNKLLLPTWVVLACCLLAACSSSTSSSGGSGQIPTGTYSGNYSGNINESPFSVTINGRLSVLCTLPDCDVVSGDLAITGQSPVDSGVRCITGGTVSEGTVNGDTLVLSITTLEAATLTMTGRVTDDSYAGTFSANDSNCPGLSGSFSFNRI